MTDLKELKDKVSVLSLVEKKVKVKQIGSLYRAQRCPICNSKEGFTIYPKTNSYCCFGANCTLKGGSAYDYLVEVEGLEGKEAMKELERLAGIKDNVEYHKTERVDTTVSTAVEYKDYTTTMLELYSSQTEADKSYFFNRGLSDEVISRYKLCVGDINCLEGDYHGIRAIIPTWKGDRCVFWNARALDNSNPKYLKSKGNSVFFNVERLKKGKKGDVVVICEGEIDALSLETIGVKAVGIGGVGNFNRVLKEFKNSPVKIVTGFDNDVEKQPWKSALAIPEKYKDLNEWLVDDSVGFKSSIKTQIEVLNATDDSLYRYINTSFKDDLMAFKRFDGRKTGFSNLDEKMNLYPGLYVIGGLSTLGKTTFVHQLADNLATRGEHVVFFSLEMSRLELMTKSLARLSVEKSSGTLVFDDGLSAIDIRLSRLNNRNRDYLNELIARYLPVSKRFNIVEGNFGTDVREIRRYTESYIVDNGVKPVVIVDYLQIVQGGETAWSNKDRVDLIVSELKRMSRDLNISVIVVSSFNRNNYLTPVGFESFKESGGIEYSADVVWGLQLQAIHDPAFSSEKKVTEKREIIEQAKKETPRAVELVCLKNRNGISSYSCAFKYWAKYDYFVPEENNKPVEAETVKII